MFYLEHYLSVVFPCFVEHDIAPLPRHCYAQCRLTRTCNVLMFAQGTKTCHMVAEPNIDHGHRRADATGLRRSARQHVSNPNPRAAVTLSVTAAATAASRDTISDSPELSQREPAAERRRLGEH